MVLYAFSLGFGLLWWLIAWKKGALSYMFSTERAAILLGLAAFQILGWAVGFLLLRQSIRQSPRLPDSVLLGIIAGEPANSNNKQSDNESDDDATVKAASTLSEGVFGHELTPDQKKIAGPAVHYAVGAAGGIVYGVAAELAPEITKGAGLPYGTAFWLVVDEGLVPLLGFAKGPGEYPLSAHAYALASHLVFGATAEVVRRLLRA